MTAPEPPAAATSVLEDRRPGPGRLVGFILFFVAVAWGLTTLSALPWAATPPDAALLKVAFKHVSAAAETSAALSPEELAKLPRHMRPQGDQTGAAAHRRDTTVRVTLDGRPILERTYRPSGFRHDGPTFVYEELSMPLGRHVLEAVLTEAGGGQPRDGAPPGRERRIVADVETRPWQILLLELSAEQRLTLRWGGRLLAIEYR